MQFLILNFLLLVGCATKVREPKAEEFTAALSLQDKEMINEYLGEQILPEDFKEKAYLATRQQKKSKENNAIELKNFANNRFDLGYSISLYVLKAKSEVNHDMQKSLSNISDVMFCVYESFIVPPKEIRNELFVFGHFLRDNYEIQELSRMLLITPMQVLSKGYAANLLMQKCIDTYQDKFKAVAVRNLQYFDINLYGNITKQDCNITDENAIDCAHWYSNLKVSSKENSKAKCVPNSQISHLSGICELRAKDNTPAPVFSDRNLRLVSIFSASAKDRLMTNPLLVQFLCDTNSRKKLEIVRKGSFFSYYSAVCADEINPLGRAN